MKRHPKKCAGFTLVELLVATMLLTIVMTAVYTLFFSVIQSWRSIENDHGYHRKSRNVVALIQRDYNNLFAPAGHLLEGSAEELTLFVLASPLLLEERSGPHLMRVRYTYHRNRGELEREEALVEDPLPPSTQDFGASERAHVDLSRPESAIVARGLSDFHFSYMWMPHPGTTYWREAPTPIAPLIASRHERRWGLPQALDLRLAYQDDESEAPYVAELRLPTQAFSQRREQYQLENILGDAL